MNDNGALDPNPNLFVALSHKRNFPIILKDRSLFIYRLIDYAL